MWSNNKQHNIPTSHLNKPFWENKWVELHSGFRMVTTPKTNACPFLKGTISIGNDTSSNPWKLTWHWKIPIFNTKYIFIHGGFSSDRPVSFRQGLFSGEFFVFFYPWAPWRVPFWTPCHDYPWWCRRSWVMGHENWWESPKELAGLIYIGVVKPINCLLIIP